MSHAFDSKALELSRQVMGLIETPMHEVQLQAKIQNLFIEAMTFAAPAVQAESILRDFYIAYGEWIDSGAPEGKPFARCGGLCANLFDYVASTVLEDLHAEFVAAGLDEKLPFNASESEYTDESGRGECHINHARVAWVRARIADGAAPAVQAEQLSGNTEQVEPVTDTNRLPFERWLSQLTGKIDVDCGCVTTEAFFHWMRTAYDAGNYPGWIPVSDRLPEAAITVLISNGADIGKAYWLDDWGYDFAGDKVPGDVTHWMPLPAAPKQETE